MKTNRPFVLINMAMSADGKIAPAHRRFVAFCSRRDHANLLALRATADAVMCGSSPMYLPDLAIEIKSKL